MTLRTLFKQRMGTVAFVLLLLPVLFYTPQVSAATATFQVSSSTDDANEVSGSLSTNSSTIWVGTGGSATASYTGLRFTNVALPQSAAVSSAYIELRSSESQWISLGYEIAAEDVGNSPTFSSSTLPSQRSLTTARVSHSSNSQWLANTWYQTEDLSPLIQAVINRADWVNGNALSIIFRGTESTWGRKFATSFNGSATNAPRLVVNFESGPTPTPTTLPTPTPSPLPTPTPPSEYLIDISTYEDKIRGGWVGQMIGVGWGYPIEFVYKGVIVPPGAVPTWTPSRVNNGYTAPIADDVYVEIPFLRGLAENGALADWNTLANYFENTNFQLWHANLEGRDNLRGGLSVPESGFWNNNSHADDIDWQIEADFVGMINPGQIHSAKEMAWRIGHTMNYGDGVYGGVFISAMQSAAFFANNVAEIIEAGRQAVPLGTEYRQVIEDVIAWHDQNPDDWTYAWQGLQDKYNLDQYVGPRCPDSVSDPSFNIDAKLHGGYILIGLLYGNGDFEESMRITMRCGQDADSSTQNVGSILGTYLGWSNIPTEFTSGLNPNLEYEDSNYDFNDAINASITVARQIVTLNGGQVANQGAPNESWTIPNRPPGTLIVEQWPASSNSRPAINLPNVSVDGLQATFDVTATDTNGVAGYQWFFGDLSYDNGANVVHTYAQPGTYNAIIFVADTTGNSNYRTVNVTVGIPTPTPEPTLTPTPEPTPLPTDTPTPTGVPTPTPTSSPANLRYLSVTSNGTIGGLSVADEDIVELDTTTGNYQMYFDGSDVGLSATDIGAFFFLPGGDILFSTNNAITLSNIGNVTAQDIIRFTPTSLGPATAGTFSLYFDGSDVGLTTSSENIDAAATLTDGRILVSTSGSNSVPGASGADEDLLAFTPTSLGDNTSGSWQVYFDGSDVGLSTSSSEDINALSVDSQGDLHFSTTGNFSVTGISGESEDVFEFVPTSLGSTTSGSFTSPLTFDGSSYGLDSFNIDGFQ